MKLLDRILVPVDLGPNTDGVVEAAGRLAAGFDARLRLLYVIEEVPHFPAALELLEQHEQAGLIRRELWPQHEPSEAVLG